jgi:hypothetical protein
MNSVEVSKNKKRKLEATVIQLETAKKCIDSELISPEYIKQTDEQIIKLNKQINEIDNSIHVMNYKELSEQQKKIVDSYDMLNKLDKYYYDTAIFSPEYIANVQNFKQQTRDETVKIKIQLNLVHNQLSDLQKKCTAHIWIILFKMWSA